MSDPVLKAYERRAANAEAAVAFLREAVNFYANRNHWMEIAPERGSPPMLLIAHGRNEAAPDGWGMAEWALKRAAEIERTMG